MSDTVIDRAGAMAKDARRTGSRLIDAQGRALDKGGSLGELGDYIREQPVSTALLALGLGYILGRLRIL